MVGDEIKGFRLTRQLGGGGMGEVWEAEQQIVKTRVAIKLLHAEISTNQQYIQRFFNEAVAVGKIKHAGAVKISDVGFHGGRAFLIMEMLEGETLAARIARARQLPIGEVAEIGRQITSVLEATHAAGIIHRDIKPENVFLTPDAELASKERVKLLDFGIAKLGVGLTVAGDTLGTPAYIPPELWNNAAKADERTDVYSLGCLVFEMCCGRPPFVAASIAEAYRMHVEQPPPRASSLAPGLPRELDDLLARMLAKAPAERPAVRDAGAVFAWLSAAAAPAVAPARASSPIALLADATSGPSPIASPAAQPSPPAAQPSPPAYQPSPPARPDRRRRWIIIGGAGMAFAIALIGSRSCGHAASPADRSADASALPGSSHPPGSCPAEMVPVPAGTFRMGSPDGVGERDEHPPRDVTLSGYCIDRTEVTVAAYAACVASKGCSAAPLTVKLSEDPAEDVNAWSRFCNRDDRPDHPINCVDWNQAVAYCKWAGKRLPSEAEWEYAARGNDGRSYPWGEEAPGATRLNACGGECVAMEKREQRQDWAAMYDASDGWETTAPVGSFRDGASPFGALDMAGNVWEWTADWYGAYSAAVATNPAGATTGTHRVTRGGGWFVSDASWVRAANRHRDAPEDRDFNLGFRCAR